MRDVLHARTDMVVADVEKDLRLMLEAAVRKRVEDTRVVALEFAARVVWLLIQGRSAAYELLPVRIRLVCGFISE